MIENLDPLLIQAVGVGGLIGIVLAVMKIADIVAKLTPTETDNKVLAVIYKVASAVALNVKDNPGKPDA